MEEQSSVRITKTWKDLKKKHWWRREKNEWSWKQSINKKVYALKEMTKMQNE